MMNGLWFDSMSGLHVQLTLGIVSSLFSGLMIWAIKSLVTGDRERPHGHSVEALRDHGRKGYEPRHRPERTEPKTKRASAPVARPAPPPPPPPRTTPRATPMELTPPIGVTTYDHYRMLEAKGIETPLSTRKAGVATSHGSRGYDRTVNDMITDEINDRFASELVSEVDEYAALTESEREQVGRFSRIMKNVNR